MVTFLGQALLVELLHRIDVLKEEFEELVMQLFALLSDSARTSPDFSDMIRNILLAIPLSLIHQHTSFFDGLGNDLECAVSVEDFQSIICSYSNFLNVLLFEQLITKLGDDDLKAELRKFMEHLDDFEASTKIVDFIEAQALSKENVLLPSELVEIQMEFGKDCTLKDVEDFGGKVGKMYLRHGQSLLKRMSGETCTCYVFVYMIL